MVNFGEASERCLPGTLGLECDCIYCLNLNHIVWPDNLLVYHTASPSNHPLTNCLLSFLMVKARHLSFFMKL